MGHGNSAPGRLGNWSVKFQRRPAVNLFFPRRFAEEQARQPGRSLKLEIDECITAPLSKNDRASHRAPGRDRPARKRVHRVLDADIAQRPVHRDHEEGDDADLQHFARGKNRVAVWMPAEHAAQHSSGGGEVGGPEKNPGEADCG